jgi:hypothetical protein
MQIFTPQQCAEIVSAFDACDNQVAEGELQNDPYYRNSYGLYQLPKALTHADYVTSIVKKIHPNIKFDSVYTRSYHNGSHLLVHTDRPDLDLTLSVCLENKRGYLWDLKVSNVPWEGEWKNGIDHTPWTGSYSTTHLGLGQGSLCEGRKYPHWRDTLVCKPEERLVYAFYHWSFTEPVEQPEPFTREQLAMDVLARLLVDTSFAVADKLLDRLKHG